MATRQENEQNAATLRELRAKADEANDPTVVARCDVLLKAIASNMADAERAVAAAPPELRRAYKEAEIEARLTPGDRALLAKASAPPPERTGLYTPEQARQRLAEMDAAKIAKDAEDAFPTAPSPRPGGPEWLERSRNEREPTTFVRRTPYLPQTWDKR